SGCCPLSAIRFGTMRLLVDCICTCSRLPVACFMHTDRRILIVEDQLLVAIDCELNLRCAGLQCVGVAATAAEAIELADRERPDLVLMDINLASRADGLHAATVIYERFGIRSIIW